MTIEKKTIDPAPPAASPASETGAGCLGLSLLLLGCIVLAVLMCVLFGNWK